MPEIKILLKFLILPRKYLENIIKHVGLSKLGDFQWCMPYIYELAEEGIWRTGRMTVSELHKCNLAESGGVPIKLKHPDGSETYLRIPYWTIQTVEFSSSGPNIREKKCHWAVWAKHPGWEKTCLNRES